MPVYLFGEPLSWFRSKLHKLRVKYLNKYHTNELNTLVDYEVVCRRNVLHTTCANVDPLSPDYPDVDSVRLNWGLPSSYAITSGSLTRLNDIFSKQV